MKTVLQVFVSSALTILLTYSILLFTDNNAFAIEFSNYTSEKYGIQFQYPSDWTIKEKASRFDNGTDIIIADYLSNRNITIGCIISTSQIGNVFDLFGFQNWVNLVLKGFASGPRKEYKTIEEPSMMSIDGKETGTFLITEQDKYDDYPVKYAKQFWITNDANSCSLSFVSPTTTFDNPENIEIRDHFIKSIKFLGESELEVEPQQKSRFD